MNEPDIVDSGMASSSAPTHSNSLDKSQYHHFIPRFILRNFAHPFQPKINPTKSFAKHGKLKQKTGYHRTEEPMLQGINLSNATAKVIEMPISRTFGLTDMYRDFADATNQHYLEEQLSVLEARAGQVVSNIRKAFDSGKPDVWITRTDRDTLRKFLFIMKYRGSKFHKRFYHQNAEGYMADDKDSLLRYMREKRFQKPIDVWFDNIQAMLELKMDPELQWMEVLQKRAYPPDATWFISNTQMFYLTLCTPQSQDDEFLLTENAYSIHEGPVSMVVNPLTGETTMRSYTEFHVFAPISSKLTIVLRSNLLPEALEDADEHVRNVRKTMFDMNASQHNVPEAVKSILEDLPVTVARNSYSRVVDGRVELIKGEDGTNRAHHKFCFRFFPIATEHVHKINGIMLEQACETSIIAFKTTLGARKTLEYYLTMDGGENGLKMVNGSPDDPRLVFLKKLEQAVRLLGSSAVAVYPMQKPRMAVELREEPPELTMLCEAFLQTIISTTRGQSILRKCHVIAQRHGSRT